MTGRNYVFSDNMSTIYLGLVIGGLLFVSTLAGSSSAVPANPEPKKIVYYLCGELYIVHCEPVPNIFNSIVLHGIISKIYDIRAEPIEYSVGQHGKALVINDIKEGSYEDYILNNQLFNPETISVSFWLKPQTGYRSGGHVISHVNSPATAGWFFDTVINETGSIRKESIKFSLTSSNGTIFSSASVPINVNNFTHFVGTFDGSSVKLYVNGVLNSSVAYDGKYEPDPDKDLTMGINSFNHYSPWSGYLDDLRIYSMPLSSGMVKEIFDGSTAVTEGLVGYWPFDGSLSDVSENKNNAIVVGPLASMSFTPDGRLFFTERNTGKVRVMEKDIVLRKPFVTLPVHAYAESGLLGLAIDPNFEQNHFVYIYYTAFDNKTQHPYNRLVRFTESDNSAGAEKELIDNIPADDDGRWSGGALTFGRDDKLYVTVGYGGFLEDPQNKSSLLGKVLRINRDGTIPTDNPFPGSPLFTIGHRNVFGIVFDNRGLGIITENGDARYDEINLLSAGGNYGFPTLQPIDAPSLMSNNSSIPPIRSYWNTIGVTQAIYYSANKFPILKDRFLYGAYNNHNVYALKLNEKKQADNEWILAFNETGGLIGPTIGIAQSPTGDLYFGGYHIFKLQSIDEQEETPVSFLVKAEASQGVNIKDLQIVTKDKTMVINIDNDNSSTSFLNLSMPKQLIQGVFKVSTTKPVNGVKQLDYSIIERPRAALTGFTFVNINHLPPSSYRLVINGTQVNGG
jgi:glucose/arabinose dehydrogenase